MEVRERAGEVLDNLFIVLGRFVRKLKGEKGVGEVAASLRIKESHSEMLQRGRPRGDSEVGSWINGYLGCIIYFEA